MLRLDNKVVLVTGCGSVGPGWGNGKAVCALFARQGAKVFGVDLTREAAAVTQGVVRDEGGTMEVMAANVTLDADAQKMVAACLERFGRIDILINMSAAPSRATPSP